MPQDSKSGEVTIFHESTATSTAPVTQTVMPEVAEIEEPIETTVPDVPQPLPAEEPARPAEPLSQPETSLTVEYVRLRPAPALLIIRLLGLGLVLIAVLLLARLSLDIFFSIFGGLTPVFDNRYFMLIIGVIFYMIMSWILYEQWSHTMYTVYFDHILLERGWIFRTKRTLDIAQFGGAIVEQGVMGKLLKYGSIRLLFAGAVGKLAGESLRDIGEPFQNYEMMMALIRGQTSA